MKTRVLIETYVKVHDCLRISISVIVIEPNNYFSTDSMHKIETPGVNL